MSMKRTVEVVIKETRYAGRFLGFLRPIEYAKTMGNAAITSRIESKETKNLMRVCKKIKVLMNGDRFVIALSKRDDKAVNKRLLISEPLDFVCQLKPDVREVEFATLKGGTITLKEFEATEGESKS